MPDIIEDFQKKGYMEQSTHIDQELLENVICAFRKFDKNTPLEEKNKVYATISEKYRIRFGYKQKIDDEGYDNKAYFHYHSKYPKDLLPENSDYGMLIQQLDYLYNLVYKVVDEFILSMEQGGAINKEDFKNNDGNYNLTMRILNYTPKPSCLTLAKSHIDRNVFTLALYETDAGLRFYHNNKIKNIDYAQGVIKIFPGDLWSELSHMNIPGTKHDVIKKEGNTERSSIVVFCLPKE